MGRRGPQGKGNEARIKSFIANLMANRPDEIRNAKGKTSSVKIAKLYHEETGEDVTRQTIASYLGDKDLINYTQATIPESNARMKDIDKRIGIAKSISNDETQKAGDRCKALNTYNSLLKTKIDYEEKLMAHKLRQAEVKRPTHLIVMCMPPAVVACPKCKHTFLIDNAKADKKHLDDWLKEHKHSITEDTKHIYKFHNILVKDQDSVEKASKPEFKSGDGQSTLDEDDKDENEKSK